MLHIECLLNPTLDPEEGRISGRGIEEGLQELRIPDTYEAKIAKTGYFGTFWPVIRLITFSKSRKKPFCPMLP